MKTIDEHHARRGKGENAMKKVCICQFSDAEVRLAAKRLNIPLTYARQVKRLHKRFKVHEWSKTR